MLVLVCGIFSPLAHALNAPFDLRGTEVKQNTVKWEWEPAEGADRYEVTVDWKVVGTTSKTSVRSYDMFPGDHYMSVRSVAPDGTKSAPTRTAKITTSREYKHGSHGRSHLMSEQPANDQPSGGSGGTFQKPEGLWAKEVEPGIVQMGWNSVSGSISYDIFVNGKYVKSTSDAGWKSSGWSNGTFTVSVRSVSGERKISEHSRKIQVEVKGGKSSSGFGAPGNLRAEQIGEGSVRWKWDSVSEASRYDVFVDGDWSGQTGNTEWVSEGLSQGERSFSVTAIKGDGTISPRSGTIKINVGGTSDSNNQSSAPPPPQQSEANPDAVNVQSLIDPESYNYSEVNNNSQWELTFSDEFNGTGLNPYRWHSQLRWDGEWNGERYEYRIINNESQFYVNVLSPDSEHQEKIVPLHNPFKFNGSRMAIQAVLNPLRDRAVERYHGRLEDVARQQPILSGAISTYDKFSQKYGRFEASIKIPGHTGAFPAFWLFHQKRSWEGTQRTEIDIMENLGHAPWYIYNSFHFFKNVSTTYSGDANFIRPEPSGQIYTGTDYSQNYHEYAVEWSPGKIKWFIDDQQVSEVNHSEVDHEKLFLLINLAFGGNWTNFPTNAGGLGRPGDQHWPTSDDLNQFGNPQLEVDYVRVYKPR